MLTPQVEAAAIVATTLPRRYMSQLCKHFQHRVAVTLDETAGRIEFPDGICSLRIEYEGLQLRVSAGNTEALARVQDVVARHLVRFGFRDELTVVWKPGPASA